MSIVWSTESMSAELEHLSLIMFYSSPVSSGNGLRTTSWLKWTKMKSKATFNAKVHWVFFMCHENHMNNISLNSDIHTVIYSIMVWAKNNTIGDFIMSILFELLYFLKLWVSSALLNIKCNFFSSVGSGSNFSIHSHREVFIKAL